MAGREGSVAFGRVANRYPDRFVGDSANESLRILSDPTAMVPEYWPLVIHGPSGSGKSALAQSFMERVAATTSSSSTESDHSLDDGQPTSSRLPSPHVPLASKNVPLASKTLRITGTDFARGIAAAIQTKSVPQFLGRLLTFAAITFDDLDDLTHFPSVQPDLVSILDRLIDGRIPVIATMKVAPNQLPADCKLCSQLISRLSAGLVIPVVYPGFTARRHLLSLLANQYDVPWTIDEIDRLARKYPLALPRLHQLVLDAKHRLSLSPSPADLPAGSTNDRSSEELADSHASLDKNQSLRCLLDLVCRQFDVSASCVLSSSRRQTVVLARSVVAYLARDTFQFSYAMIGDFLGGRDHSTTMHAYRKITCRLADDLEFRRIIDDLRRQLVDFSSLGGSLR